MAVSIGIPMARKMLEGAKRSRFMQTLQKSCAVSGRLFRPVAEGANADDRVGGIVVHIHDRAEGAGIADSGHFFANQPPRRVRN